MNMASFKFPMCLLTLSLLTMLSLTTTEAAPTYAAHTCSNSSFFTPNSTYQANLNLLLSALPSNATHCGGFYSAVVGQAPPNVVIGRLLYHADLSPDFVRSCDYNQRLLAIVATVLSSYQFLITATA
jgi:hypothetical protein